MHKILLYSLLLLHGAMSAQTRIDSVRLNKLYHRVILFKLNADYASLYDENGNSSQNLSTPYSNIQGGLGIFSGINSDTLMVEVTK